LGAFIVSFSIYYLWAVFVAFSVTTSSAIEQKKSQPNVDDEHTPNFNGQSLL
jgi:hypothetical protein